MLYIALWLVCGVVAAVIYQRKGRGWVNAALVGFIFGPIGVLLAALTPPDWSEVQRCPNCREINPRHFTKCKACGSTLA